MGPILSVYISTLTQFTFGSNEGLLSSFFGVEIRGFLRM